MSDVNKIIIRAMNGRELAQAERNAFDAWATEHSHDDVLDLIAGVCRAERMESFDRKRKIEPHLWSCSCDDCRQNRSDWDAQRHVTTRQPEPSSAVRRPYCAKCGSKGRRLPDSDEMRCSTIGCDFKWCDCPSSGCQAYWDATRAEERCCCGTPNEEHCHHKIAARAEQGRK